MERHFLHRAELQLRRDLDFLNSLNMVAEGAPVHCPVFEGKLVIKYLKSIEQKGYEKSSTPQSGG
ncbi:hypothetical protein [Sporosarcina obsidiansis]|uniref:hypothetical protein n=1 Tax=Sporosarcina obsidiansis TaxID=2660748 RepID=UPI00129AED11|nr:hypothetical protein [Sporosarcina obsidiansis]